MKATRVYDYNVTQEVTRSVAEQKENLFYFVAERTVAFKGYNNYIDTSYCYRNNIQIIDLNNEGGVIVSSKGSLSVGHISQDIKNTFNAELTKYLAEFLQSKGLDVSISENDILIDGTYKVASSSTRQFGKVLFSAFHISHEVNLNIIKSLCTKPMKKIPKGLGDYGITESEIIELFYRFINLV
jgi:hypothetical protein